MSKREKKKKVEKVKSGENESIADSLAEKIGRAAEDLYYISETDAEILPFAGGTAETVTKEELLKQTESDPDALVEERDFNEFFARLTKIQDWFEEKEMATVKKFVALMDLLERNLRDLRVFKIGRIEINIYAVGLDAENKLTGIQTKAVET